MAPARGRALTPSQSCFTLLCQIQARNPANQMEARKTVEICPLLNRTLNVVELFPCFRAHEKAAAGLRSATASYALLPRGYLSTIDQTVSADR